MNYCSKCGHVPVNCICHYNRYSEEAIQERERRRRISRVLEHSDRILDRHILEECEYTPFAVIRILAKMFFWFVVLIIGCLPLVHIFGWL